MWLCGASTAGIFIARTGLISDKGAGDAGGLLAASGSRSNAVVSHGEMRTLAEQTRQALVALTASEVDDVRRRYGIRSGRRIVPATRLGKC